MQFLKKCLTIMKKNLYNDSRTFILDETAAQSSGRAVSFYIDGFL